MISLPALTIKNSKPERAFLANLCSKGLGKKGGPLLRQLALSAVIVFSLGCDPHKVPLNYSPREIELVASHWYENEKVTYLFFKIRGAAKIDSLDLMEWTLVDSESSEQQSLYQPFRPESAVHEHRLVPCAQDLCGSFSVYSKQAPRKARMRLKYHAKSLLFAESETVVNSHSDDGTSNSFSQLLFGTFDALNTHLQIHTLANFGTPLNGEISSYGLTRRLRINGGAAYHWTKTTLDQQRRLLRTPTLFSQTPCDQWAEKDPRLQISNHWDFTTRSESLPLWIPISLTSANEAPGVCFRAEFLDQKGQTLTSGVLIGRKNPEVLALPLKIKTPLQPARSIPIILSYCEKQGAETPAMTSILFLEYQKFILQAQGQSTDLCFNVGQEETFEGKLKGLLADKLRKAKASAVSQRDFIFTVILNHRQNSEFQGFQEIVASQLHLLIESERLKQSPRLVGAFVYDSDAHFQTPQLAHQNIIWCPQMPLQPSSATNERFDAGINCLVNDAEMLKSSLLNFLIPMGPFPSLTTYENYWNQYGDKGFIRDPQFEVKSVTVNALTVQDLKERTTFFESETLHLEPSEGLRLCFENDFKNSLLPHLRFRSLQESDKILTANELIPYTAESALGISLQLGIFWEYAFYGGIRYNTPVSGSVLGLIPFEKSFKSYTILGDQKWQLSEWNLNNYFQKCQRFCDHPFFDEAGIYQLNERWKTPSALHCVRSKAPRFEAMQ